MGRGIIGAIFAPIAAAAVAGVAGSAVANAAPAAPLKQDWTKSQCMDWNATVGTAQTCAVETHPGDLPPDWNTPNHTPFLDQGGNLRYGPGAVVFDR